ncbi:hypothetical protein DFP74_2266 [Nocardiopsis sp. Huas11]|uniref:hypothetical protein n=1 Tax=Nocardiopsis sp. Huas11 TaxID=2183912 RepID=UPI000EB4A51A|nr:hypothetical protein [Nocardiopsis sp. Huas11]RKS06625.1 hypothetical protein DFP74_2266 [Nocardiopsis sp. Huas11]
MNPSRPTPNTAGGPDQGPFANIPWSLVLGLGALALVRPLLSITGVTESLGWSPWLQLTVTAAVSLAWIVAVVVARAPRPLLTLVYTGLTYGVFAIVLSAVLSPFLTGELQGPVTNPFGLVSVLATNAVWGLVCGAVALAVRSALNRGRSRI